MTLSKEKMLKVYQDMVLIRRFEEVIEKYSKNGTIPGFIHLSIGQEAAQAGVIDVLRETDYKFPDHRCHGAIVLSSQPDDRKNIMSEIFGRKTGINGGRGGSMHINDLKVRNMGFNGIQGSTVVTGLGTAFASVYNQTDDVTVVFMGDGTLGEGTCHESMNMAATWKLPLIYVLINNQYAISTPYFESHPQKNLSDWAKGYNVPSETIDGNDIEVVIQSTQKAVDHARSGQGPTLLEMMTYRWQGHFSGDPAAYRPEGELEKWKERCPIKLAKERLINDFNLRESDISSIHQEAEIEVQNYLEFSLESPWPSIEDATSYVYTDLAVEERK
ncbi:MAG: thiamine pyrophosphate-dependent dehydrogenase E1 component subunit alpha [Anaerolineaceae bacterium]|nr:thiamine pyrophosphate-dependent dehydrogenase E1 component subunit alpha [Anaerolineaceae bacterium]